MKQPIPKARSKALQLSLVSLAALAAVLLFIAIRFSAPAWPTREEIIINAKGMDTPEKLERTLGQPWHRAKYAQAQRWRYKAKDGDVLFNVENGKVTVVEEQSVRRQ